MKYNPKLNEATSSLEGFAGHHPLTPMKFSQGSLELIYRLQAQLSEISGFAQASLQPAAGAQGELTGVLMIRAYHTHRGETKRRKMLIPDSPHGTNPATVTMAGYEVVEIPSDSEGNVDLAALKAACDDTVAGLMITNPNSLGLFERSIEQVTKAVHDCGGLVYGDGANMNAILGILRPGDVGIDVMHFNLQKTFSTPHGGGGPESGPVATKETLVEFLPGPIVEEAHEHPELLEQAPHEMLLRRFDEVYAAKHLVLRAQDLAEAQAKQYTPRIAPVALGFLAGVAGIFYKYIQHTTSS